MSGNPKPLTSELAVELAALESLSDDTIDTSDMQEISAKLSDPRLTLIRRVVRFQSHSRNKLPRIGRHRYGRGSPRSTRPRW